MILETKCPECKEVMKIDVEVNKPKPVKCDCGCEFIYTKGRGTKRPEYLDIVIHGTGFIGA